MESPGWILDPRPLLGIDGTIYLRSRSGTLHAISPKGEIKWQITTGPFEWDVITVSPDGKTLYVNGTGQRILAINAQNGTEQWSVQTGFDISMQATVDNQGHIYFCRAVHADTVTQVVCMNPDGSERWTYSHKQIHGGRLWAPFNGINIAYNGYLYVGITNDGLLALDHDGHFRWLFTTAWKNSFRPTLINGTGNLLFAHDLGPTLYTLTECGHVLEAINAGAISGLSAYTNHPIEHFVYAGHNCYLITMGTTIYTLTI